MPHAVDLIEAVLRPGLHALTVGAHLANHEVVPRADDFDRWHLDARGHGLGRGRGPRRGGHGTGAGVRPQPPRRDGRADGLGIREHFRIAGGKAEVGARIDQRPQRGHPHLAIEPGHQIAARAGDDHGARVQLVARFDGKPRDAATGREPDQIDVSRRTPAAVFDFQLRKTSELSGQLQANLAVARAVAVYARVGKAVRQRMPPDDVVKRGLVGANHIAGAVEIISATAAVGANHQRPIPSRRHPQHEPLAGDEPLDLDAATDLRLINRDKFRRLLQRRLRAGPNGGWNRNEKQNDGEA